MSDETTIMDLQLRSHSWRGYEPQEFIDVAINDGKVNARKELGTLEGGRFEPLLEAGHKFIVRLDPDEIEEFASRNQDFTNWISVWGFLQDLNRLRDYHTLDYSEYER